MEFQSNTNQAQSNTNQALTQIVVSGFFSSGVVMFSLNAAALLLYTTMAQTVISNAANIELQSNITMTVSAEQGNGACWPGYLWNHQYGGCRRLELEQQTEYAACPPGYSGQQSRLYYRYNYIGQTNGDVASDPWFYNAWNTSTCAATLPPTLPPRIAESLQVDYAHGANFGANSTFYAYLMLHKNTGTLWCYAAILSSEVGRTLYEYPAEGIFYSQTSPKYRMNQCQINENTVSFGGQSTGYGTIYRTAVSNNGCTHHFNRVGQYGPYPTPFNNTIHVC